MATSDEIYVIAQISNQIQGYCLPEWGAAGHRMKQLI